MTDIYQTNKLLAFLELTYPRSKYIMPRIACVLNIHEVCNDLS